MIDDADDLGLFHGVFFSLGASVLAVLQPLREIEAFDPDLISTAPDAV